jgi:glycosyltransferase involved in cell wall biosynthesis
LSAPTGVRDTARVVLACDWFLKYAVAQAAGLAGRGVQVLLLVRDHAFEFGGDDAERERALERARGAGVEVVQLPGRLWDPQALPALWRIRRRVDAFAPDIVHVHDRVDPRVLALVPRVPAVLTVHDPVDHPGQPTSRLALKRRVLEGSRQLWRHRAGALIVHSEHLQSELTLRPGQRSVVVPHGLDVRAQPLAAPDAPAVGFFGRLAPYKGLEVIARAMPQVWEQRPEVQVRVCGEGDAAFELADARADVHRGYLPESEVEGFFAATTLLLLPYTQASQTGVGSLAAGFGVPAVVSRLGGLPDLALDPSYVVTAGDAEDLARAILAHLDDGSEVRTRVLREVAGPFSWDACAERTIEIYQTLLEA